jgi:DNA-binding NarL/FixJ family response regulator
VTPARRAKIAALIARVRRQVATAELRRRRLAHEAEIAARARARAEARRAPPLSPRYAEILRLSSEEGLTYEEIGERLGGVTRQRVGQIMRKLRARGLV